MRLAELEEGVKEELTSEEIDAFNPIEFSIDRELAGDLQEVTNSLKRGFADFLEELKDGIACCVQRALASVRPDKDLIEDFLEDRSEDCRSLRKYMNLDANSPIDLVRYQRCEDYRDGVQDALAHDKLYIESVIRRIAKS